MSKIYVVPMNIHHVQKQKKTVEILITFQNGALRHKSDPMVCSPVISFALHY
jgi:hypothetical protein